MFTIRGLRQSSKLASLKAPEGVAIPEEEEEEDEEEEEVVSSENGVGKECGGDRG